MKRHLLAVATHFRVTILTIALLGFAGASFATQGDDCIEAPDFDVVAIDESRISLADMKGRKPVYLKFWLSTCPQCIAVDASWSLDPVEWSIACHAQSGRRQPAS